MFKNLFRILFFLSLWVTSASAQQLAFPEAEGGGRFAVGGRGGTVYEVTNLSDSGTGSLRDAVSQPNRTIVFRVSGEIKLLSRLSLKQNNITIAGQTAPGDGICITGNTLNIQANNIIIRYIRCRFGDANAVEDDAINCWSGNFQNIIIDHCSFSWSIDETATFYDIRNFTLQWCIVSESLFNSIHNKGQHGYAGIWGGENASYHHNLIAHHTSRTPRFNGTRYVGQVFKDSTDFRNNVVYNWGNINSAYGGEGGFYNMVNNYYKAGPATAGSLTTSSASNKRNRIFNYTSFYYNGTDTVWGGKFYVNGNFVNGYPDVTADNWTKGMQKDSYANATALLAAAKQANAYNFAPVRTQTAEAAYVSVLDSAGAILPCRDTIDRRIIRETRTGTATFEGATYGVISSTGISHPSGIIDSPADVGGVPVYNSTPAPLDTDKDGMPDAYEVAKGLNPNNAADRNNAAANGYTQLEIYLNSITSPCTTRTTTIETAPSVLSAYPNPTNDQLIINHADKAGTLSVYDAQGRKVLSQVIQNATQTVLDVHRWSNGVYWIQYQTDAQPASLKFIKQ
ncbi:MAG: T9SS type A sorting domain-containing protein [Saprospiraceae bacterium]|nr:T9SS type A sorting domain-containing protein [Saprospiraceae bacterium]